MKIIIAGGRDFKNYNLLERKMNAILARRLKNLETITIVSGGARGADYFGERYAGDYNFLIEHFKANWDAYGKSAGYRRNTTMAAHSDALVAFWDGQSKGTKHMIDIMRKLNKPVRVINY